MPKIKTALQNRSGISLVELIIYMGIVVVLIYVLTDLLYSTLNVQLASQSDSEVAQDGRYIYSRLTYDINRAQAVSLPLNLGDTSSTLQLTIGGITYSYAISGGDLVLTENTGSYVLNSPTTDVSNISFERIGNVNGKDTFQIKFTVESTIEVNNRFDSEVFQTTAGLR